VSLTGRIVYVAGKTCIANGGDRHQRSSSPSYLASSRVIGSHAAGVMLPKLVPATGPSPSGVTAVRKSACLGGQSLATSAAKRLLARPACRGGRMMPERPVQHCPTKKKRKPKRVAPKVVMNETVIGSKCVRDQKSQPRQPAPASVIQNSSTPAVPANARLPVAENVPLTPLPRIVIKIHQGKIVSPPTIVSASTVGVKKQTPEHNGSGDLQERKRSDPGTQRTERSDRMKDQPPPKPVKLAANSKLNPKNASQSVSSKVMADKNSGVTYFDSTKLQDSGSFDKLSLDCCMKLYSQIRDQQKPSQPSQSLSESSTSKKSKLASKNHRRSPTDRAMHTPESKKRLLSGTSAISEPLAKVRADGIRRDTAKFSASHPPHCRVELSRIKSSTDTRTSFHKLSDDTGCRVNGSVSEKSACGGERWLRDNVNGDFGAVGSDDATNDCCSATLPHCSHTTLREDASVQQNDVPTATVTVPGLSTPLSKPSQSFSKKSHTPAENDSTVPRSSYMFCAAETSGRLDSSEKSQTGLLSGALNHTKTACSVPAAKKTDKLSGSSGGLEVPTDCIAVENFNDRLAKNSSLELVDSRVADNRSLESSVGRKRCSSTAHDDSLDDGASRPDSAKQTRLSRPPCERLTVLPPASAVVDEMSSASSLPSITTTSITDVAACETRGITDLTSVSEPLSAVVGWTPPSSPPDTCQTSEANTSPLRLKIRRLPNTSPVPEIYNVIGQDADSDSTASTSRGILSDLY